jgi:hypothetical protein
MRDFFMRLFNRTDIKNTNGLDRFGERCLNDLIRTAKIRASQAAIENIALESRKKATEDYINSVSPENLFTDNEFFGIRKKIQTGTFFIAGIFITEGLLSYYSTLVFIKDVSPGIALLRWLIAAVLTFGAISASEKLIESVLPRPSEKTFASKPRSYALIALWLILVVGVQLAIIGLAETRVRDIEGGKTGSVLYFGFIALSMVLPIIAGAIAWEISTCYDSYKLTKKFRKLLLNLEEYSNKINQNLKIQEDYYEITLMESWDKVNDFRSAKEYYDSKHRVDGVIHNGYVSSYESFKSMADTRFRQIKMSIGRTDAEHTQTLALPAVPKKKLLEPHLPPAKKVIILKPKLSNLKSGGAKIKKEGATWIRKTR